MPNSSDILELKFDGNGINPSKVKASEIAALIKDFEDAIVTTIKNESPAIDIEQVLICFDTVKNKSIAINLKPNSEIVTGEVKKIVDRSYKVLTTAIASNDYSKLSNSTIVALRSISKFTNNYQCPANFKKNGKFLSAINPDTEIKLNKSGYLKGDTTIYGELVDAGGDNPNIHIKINGEYTVIIDTDKLKAKELAARLYDQVGLKGSAKWDIITSKILEFKLHEVLEYAPGNVSKTFSELKKLTSGYWDKFNNNDDINKNLLRD